MLGWCRPQKTKTDVTQTAPQCFLGVILQLLPHLQLCSKQTPPAREQEFKTFSSLLFPSLKGLGRAEKNHGARVQLIILTLPISGCVVQGDY